MELRHRRLQEAWSKDFQPLKCGCYRRMLRILWTEKVSNEEVLERAKIKKRLYITQTKKTAIFWAHHPPEWRHTAPHSFGWKSEWLERTRKT